MSLFLAALILVILIGILFNTIIMFLELKKFSWWKNKTVELDKYNEFEEKVESYVYLNTFRKWKFWIYGLSFSILITVNGNSVSNIFGLILIITCLVAIGDFIHSGNRWILEKDLFIKVLFYFLQLFVLFLYILSFNIVYLDEVNFEVLLILTVLIIFYSFLFVKNVIDTFTSYFFQFFNFSLILLLFNFVVIGFNYGLFYLSNNDIFQDFSLEEAEEINQKLSDGPVKLEHILAVTHEGIEPFFNFPSRTAEDTTLISFIPLIEHFIGNVFNLLIIGFFVSYSVTTLFERRTKKLEKKNV